MTNYFCKRLLLLILTVFILQIPLLCHCQDTLGERKAKGQRLSPEDDEFVDVTQSKVFGPGIVPHEIVLPARYFYVKLVGYDGQSINETVDLSELKVRIDCNGERHIWTQILDLKEGLFIVRYKLFQTCSAGLRIIVTYQNQNIAKSPYNIRAKVHPDGCYCPKYEARKWLNKAKCPPKNKQIENDLLPFEEVNFDEILEKVIDKFHLPTSHSFCHYVVKENQIYRKCYGEHVGFHIFPDSILQSLTRKMYLPDFEFIMNLGDWPLVNKFKISPPVPIFSWCKSNETLDILLPTYELTEASLEAMGRVSLDIQTAQSNGVKKWKERIPKLFWRGRDSRQERLDLVMLSRKYPGLINASLTNFFFFRDQESIYGPKTEHVSFFKFFDYKYQLAIDGTVAAYRTPFLLAGGSLVFKANSQYIEHFYRDLKPWTHYIPVESDLSDLIGKIKWAIINDNESKIMAQNARHYAQEHLMPLNVLCYHVLLYKEWSKRLKNHVHVRADMEHVKPTETKNTICDCIPAQRDFSNFDEKDEL